MTTYYVDADATGLDNGTSWVNAYTSVTDLPSLSNEDVVRIANTHAEASSTTIDLTGPSNGKPVLLISLDPSDDSYLKSTVNTIEVTGTTADIILDGAFACMGVNFKSGDRITFGADANETMYIADCTVDCQADGINAMTLSLFASVDFVFGTSGFFYGGSFGCINCTFTGSSAQIFNMVSAGTVIIRGCDLTGVTGSTLVSGYHTSVSSIEFIGCRLPSGVATGTTFYNLDVRFYECDIDAGNNQDLIQLYRGTLGEVYSTESIYRSSSDEEYSLVMEATAGTSVYQPIWSPYITIPIGSTGSKTITAYIANETEDLTNKEVILEVEYFDSTSNTNKKVETTVESNPLITATTYTDDTTSTWEDSTLTLTYKQTLSKTVTVNKVGSLRVRVGSCYSTDTVYVCPDVEIS